MTAELLNKTIKAINAKLANAKVSRQNKYWNCCTAKFTFGNNRVVTIYKHIPSDSNLSKRTTDVHYTICFLGNHAVNTQYRLDEVAKKLYEMGLENVDLFKDGVNTKKLRELGFEQVERLQEPNIKDIGYYLEEGFYQYKFEVDESKTYYGREYNTGVLPYYYGSTYQDMFYREYLYVRHSDNGKWFKALYRDVKIGSRCVNNYVGD